MFKKLPGDEARNLVSTTPDTAIVFRPAVVKTPALITIIIWLTRLVTGVVRLVVRHPIVVAVMVALGVIWTMYGYLAVLAIAGLVVMTGLSWTQLHAASFLRLVGWPLLGWWRLVWVYRRHWAAVMTISGLARSLHARDYLPTLVKVACDDWADRVAVRMLNGQAAKDWADRTDNLGHGFGAPSCRVSITRAGRLLLTFPRHDPLTAPLPAVPIPQTASVGPV
ncbi:hypothetical protein AB0B89_16860 [Sphaerisporangium sp. NPDC049002]|uniref:hypothetical protein n=1 Tax=Sphaerisporangium sp. NPDC049002 TaxID=3155392 RepID=UPI0033F65298